MLIQISFYDKAQNPQIRASVWDGGLTLSMDDPEEGEIILDVAKPIPGETGVYWAASALEHFLEQYSDCRVVQEWDRKFASLHEHLAYLHEWGKGYGVADNLEQIKEAFPQYWYDDRNFILALSTVHKADQPERDGWRWEKWGPYIGTQNSVADYLFDEPEIKELILYSFVEVIC